MLIYGLFVRATTLVSPLLDKTLLHLGPYFRFLYELNLVWLGPSLSESRLFVVCLEPLSDDHRQYKTCDADPDVTTAEGHVNYF